jgi:hypothetical protein
LRKIWPADHTSGQTRRLDHGADHFRSIPISRHMRSRGARLKGANGRLCKVWLAEFIIGRAFARPVSLAHPAIYDRCNQPAAIPERISARSSSISHRPFLVSMCRKVQPLRAPEPCATAPTALGWSRDCPTGKSGRLPIIPCPAFYSKNSVSRLPQINSRTSAVPSHRGAARDRHERGTGCGGREAARKTNARASRTAKSCGPDAPTLAFKSANLIRR